VVLRIPLRVGIITTRMWRPPAGISEGAFLRGNRPTVVADACATRPLRALGTDVSADQLHHSALATISDIYGVVVPSASALR
jgi:hypothetical protein